MKKKVIILGGGVAGMSAAHELIERGFEVEVFERNKEYVGGKARSVNVPGTNTQYPDKYLPGEHGFRFFPGFYKHVTDTMKRIPKKMENGKPVGKETCFDNLVDTDTIMITKYDGEPIVFPTNFLKNLASLKMLYSLFKNREKLMGLKPGEASFFGKRMLSIMASCTERREDQYEKIGWWDFMQADDKSDAYKKLLVIGITRTLVAADAHKASTKTDGNIIIQLLYNFVNPTIRTDRVFDAPTNEAWLDPWFNYLTSKGVVYHKHAIAQHFNMENGSISSVKVHMMEEDKIIEVKGDYYLLAAPADRAFDTMTDEMKAVDPALSKIEYLIKDMSWMTGMQYYLNQEVNINPGHVNYAYTQWALTSFDQIHFWKNYSLSDRYNGKVKSILSVDISDWTDPDQEKRVASKSDIEQIEEGVWQQLKESLNRPGQTILDDSMKETYYLDHDIIVHQGGDFNKERMLVNTINSWVNRPEATTQIPNFFLASDYVRTYTDLATMEAANEAARRAVNGILIASGSNAAPCKLWPLDEPALFNPVKWYDRIRYKKDPQSTFRIPFWLKVVMIPWGLIYGIYFLCRVAIFKLLGLKPQ